MTIHLNDCREFFEVNPDETGGINHAKINTISLLLAKRETNSELELVNYKDIRPLTKINFPNEPLSDIHEGLDIIYQVLY